MMDAVTITLNPAIDQTVYVERLEVGTLNRMQAMHLTPGGKGVNVASYLADYGFHVAATGFLGLENAALFEEWFARKNIQNRFVYIPGSTRTNIKLVDRSSQQTTEINMPGLAPTAEAQERLMQVIEDLSRTCNWFVLSGNLPPGLAVDTYARLITYLKQRGCHVILDTSQEALKAGLTAGPNILKPNLDELAQLAGDALRVEDVQQVEAVGRDLLSHGIDLVVVSMGKAGAVFITAAESFLAVPPPIPVESTVGAGDAMVAGLLAAHLRGLDLAESARLATAFSLGALGSVGANLPQARVIHSLVSQVSVRALVRTHS